MPTVVMNKSSRLTAEEIEARVWAFVIVALVLILRSEEHTSELQSH